METKFYLYFVNGAECVIETEKYETRGTDSDAVFTDSDDNFVASFNRNMLLCISVAPILFRYKDKQDAR